MQALVYIFVALACVGVGAAAYFGFTFTPIEAIVTALVFGGIAMMLVERGLRQRSEARLEKAIADLSRLLSTDAQAGAVLSHRINALTDARAAPRLDALEADVSVLGTVVRQVAEAVAELEEGRKRARAQKPAADPEPDPDTFPEPVIPLELVRQAIEDDRLICHVEPVVKLPMRKPYCYVVVPRLMLEDGDVADPPDFMPRRGGADIVSRIEVDCLSEAVVIGRRARTGGQPILLQVPLSRATLAAPDAVEQMLAVLDANKAVAGNLAFVIAHADQRAFGAAERSALVEIGKRGVQLAIAGAVSLRIDFAELQGLGVRTIEVNASQFIDRSGTLTDFHASDAAEYARRYGIELVGGGVITDQQLLALFEDGVTLARGPFIGGPGPVRADLSVDRSPRPAAPRRAEV